METRTYSMGRKMTLEKDSTEEQPSLPEGRFYNINFKIFKSWMRNIGRKRRLKLKEGTKVGRKS
jgi:hypothetical protein